MGYRGWEENITDITWEKTQITVPHLSVRKEIREGACWISYLKLRIWLELHLSEHTVQAEENYIPGIQTAEYISAWVCVIFKQSKTLQVLTSLFSTATSCGVLSSWKEMWKVFFGRAEHLAWLSGSLPQSRDEGILCMERRCAASPLALWHRDKPGWSWAPFIPQQEACPAAVPFSSVRQNRFDAWAEQSDLDYKH